MNDAAVVEGVEARGRRFYYGWVVLFVAAVAMVATLPGRTIGLGLITEPLLADLKLSRVAYGWMNLWGTLIGALFAAGCGRLIDRAGARVVLTVNAALLGMVVLAMSGARSHWALFAALTLTRGLGQSALSVVSAATVGKWFARRINGAMGAFSAITAVLFIAAIPSVQYAVQVTGDWRRVWAGVGWAILAGVAPMAWLLVRRTPESVGLMVDGGAVEAAPVTPSNGGSAYTLRRALLTPAFWVLACSCAVFNLIFSGVSLFAEAIIRERGLFDPATFRNAMAVLALSGIAANGLGGWLAGRVTHGRLMTVGMAIVTAAMVVLPTARGVGAVMAFAGMMGAAGGVVTVVFFACWPRAFGRKNLGQIQGAAQVLTVLASAAGPVLLAIGEARRGTYGATFLILAPVVGVMAAACWFVRIPRAELSAGAGV